MSNAWHFDIRDDLFAIQHPEDGSDFLASVFNVVAVEKATGRRFVHNFSFGSAHVVSDEDGCYIFSYREEALLRATKLLARIQAADASGSLASPAGSQYWTETQPVYGSAEYGLQEREIVASEEREALLAEALS